MSSLIPPDGIGVERIDPGGRLSQANICLLKLGTEVADAIPVFEFDSGTRRRSKTSVYALSDIRVQVRRPEVVRDRCTQTRHGEIISLDISRSQIRDFESI